MPSPVIPDSSITYHNPFQNTIFDNQQSSAMSSKDPNDPIYQNFTATGRPLPTSRLNHDGWADAIAADHSYGAAAPNLLPVRFTDNSIISVPVLPHAEPTQTSTNNKEFDSSASSLFSDDSTANPIKEQEKSKSRFSISGGFRRKSSSKSKHQDFVIKQMTRGNYLKFYAKDDNGRFIGSEEPAGDCILNNEEDRVKYRRV